MSKRVKLGPLPEIPKDELPEDELPEDDPEDDSTDGDEFIEDEFIFDEDDIPPPLPQLALTTTDGPAPPKLALQRYFGQLKDAYQMCKKAPTRRDDLCSAAETFYRHSADIKPSVGRPVFRDVIGLLRHLLSEDDLRTVSAAAQTLAEYNSITVAELGDSIGAQLRECSNTELGYTEQISLVCVGASVREFVA